MEFYVGRIAACNRLKKDLRGGTYKLRPGTKVEVFRPKYRVATAPWFRDRVWQRSMCNNGVYKDLTGSFILDNIACQKGKGQDMAIRRVIGFLQRLHREAPGQPIYGYHLDIKKYFPSTPHAAIKALDAERIQEPRFLPYLVEIVDSVKDERAPEEIARDPFGERGTGLGSQINQLNQIALLDKLDHRLKCFCRFYIRYNDDFLILSHNKATVQQAKDVIREHLETRGLILTDKGGIFKAENGFYFLRKRFILKPSGKIILRLHPRALAEERRQLRNLKRLVCAGHRTMQDVQVHYQSWIANAEYCGDAPIRAMDAFYIQTFGQRPVYKRKRRYLYGENHCKPAGEAAPG